MIDSLFEQARLAPPECPAEFVRQNLPEIVQSNISPFDIVEMAGRLSVNAFEPGVADDTIAQINDQRIWGDRRFGQSQFDEGVYDGR